MQPLFSFSSLTRFFAALLFSPFRLCFFFRSLATFLTVGASLEMNVDREMMIGCRVQTEKGLLWNEITFLICVKFVPLMWGSFLIKEQFVLKH